jgi:hypothetical protein
VDAAPGLNEGSPALRLAVIALLASLTFVGGCGGSRTVPDGPVRLAEMQSDERPYYWLGDSFEGLQLTAAWPYEGRFGSVVYGTCEAPTGLLRDGGCAPPLEVQNVLCRDGRAGVALFAGGGGLAARAAKALRPLNRAAAAAGKPVVTFDRSARC